MRTIAMTTYLYTCVHIHGDLRYVGISTLVLMVFGDGVIRGRGGRDLWNMNQCVTEFSYRPSNYLTSHIFVQASGVRLKIKTMENNNNNASSDVRLIIALSIHISGHVIDLLRRVNNSCE